MAILENGFVNEASRISASCGPADAVLPQAHPGDGLLGLVMLDTRFPRPPGDLGRADAWPWPVRCRVVQGAWPAEVVVSAQTLRASSLVPAFVQAMRELQGAGARAIVTSCGFLVLLQRELQQAVQVPVVSSSLLELPRLLAREKQVGVLTISVERLGQEHLLAAGVARERWDDVLVQGVDPQGEFASAILGNREQMDRPRAGADVVSAARALKARAPRLRTVVLECTNMPPYADAIREATGLEIVSLRDSARLLQALHVGRQP
jgi:hypothetical protein